MKSSENGLASTRFVAYLLCIAGGSLTLFLGALTLSDSFFAQVTGVGGIIIFFTGLSRKIPDTAIFSSLVVVISSLSVWYSMPNEVRFGLPSRFADFSPLAFLGPLLSLVGGILAFSFAIPTDRAALKDAVRFRKHT